jgi:hypothetical protein
LIPNKFKPAISAINVIWLNLTSEKFRGKNWRQWKETSTTYREGRFCPDLYIPSILDHVMTPNYKKLYFRF